MLHLTTGPRARNCAGFTRRAALKAGFLGILGLNQADLLRLRAEGRAARNDKSVILLWLDGGPSQLETYDPKPEAAVEFRGPYDSIATSVSGVRLCEMLPGQARIAKDLVFVRSLAHGTGDHFAGAHWMLTGRFGSTTANMPQKSPSVGSIVAKVLGPNRPELPPYVGLPAAESVYLYPGYMGAAYLGAAYNPFDVDKANSYLGVTDGRRVGSPKWLTPEAAAGGRFEDRRGLLAGLDRLRRDADNSGALASVDHYQQQALDMILSGRGFNAFDLDKEDPKLAERYGTSPWARYTLMARRLVEAGVSFVTVDMPHWDDHSNIKNGHGAKVPVVDRAVTALVEDLKERGLFDKVVVIVMGEFGRTPRINTGQPGIPVPGRDHWGNAISAMICGGGIRGGQVVGKTNKNAEHPVERALSPADLLATVYHVLGIDHHMTFKDHLGRPIPLVDDGEPIAEIV